MGPFELVSPRKFAGAYPIIENLTAEHVLLAGLEWVEGHKRHREKMRNFIKYALLHPGRCELTGPLYPELKHTTNCCLEFYSMASWRHHQVKFHIDFDYDGVKFKVKEVFDWSVNYG